MYQASEPGNQQHPPLKGHRSRRVYMHVKLISRKSLVPIQLFGLVGLVGKVGLDQEKSLVPIQRFLLNREIVCVRNVIYFQLISESNLRQRIFFEEAALRTPAFVSLHQPRSQFSIFATNI